jgi:hypothetical protein
MIRDRVATSIAQTRSARFAQDETRCGCGMAATGDGSLYAAVWGEKILRELKLRREPCGTTGAGPNLWNMYLPQTCDGAKL